MKRIQDLGYDFFIDNESFKNYEEIANNKNLSATSKIYKLITLNPGFMFDVQTDEDYFIEKTKKTTFEEIDKLVKKKKEIILVTFHFNTKPSIKTITNNYIGPDASDFLTLLHLNTITMMVNKFYEPGFSIRIGSEITYFHYFAMIELDEARSLQENIFKFNSISSNLIDKKGAVFIYDLYEEIERYKEDFTRMVEREKNIIINTENSIETLENFAKYYLNNVIDLNKFANESIALRFAFFHSLDATGYKYALIDMFDTDRGLFKNYKNTTFVQSRFVDDSHVNNETEKPEVYCSMLPGAETFSFNLLTLRTKDRKWKQIKYQEVLEKGYKPFYVREVPYPLFFTEIDGDISA